MKEINTTQQRIAMKKIKPIWIKYRLLIPLGIMTMLCLQTIYKYLFKTQENWGFSFDYYLSTKHYISFAVVIINWLVFFIYRPIFKYVLGATFILGLCNLLCYTIGNHWVRPELFMGDLRIGFTFQPISLRLIILTYIICFRKVNRIISQPFRLSPEQKQKVYNEELEKETLKFKEKYASYANESLQAITEKKEYTAGAREAAKQLLEERLNTQ